MLRREWAVWKYCNGLRVKSAAGCGRGVFLPTLPHHLDVLNFLKETASELPPRQHKPMLLTAAIQSGQLRMVQWLFEQNLILNLH